MEAIALDLKKSPLGKMYSPFKQAKLSFEGTGINKSFLGKGTRYMERQGVAWDWQGGQKYPYGEIPSGTEETKTKTTATLKAGVDFGDFKLHGEASASGQTFQNKPFTGFKEDTRFSDATITSRNDAGFPVTLTGQRDVAGDTHTSFGNIYKKRIGGGFQFNLGGKNEAGFMASVSGGGGAEKTSQSYITRVASGKPLSGLNSNHPGFSGGGPGSIDSSLGSSGNITSNKLFGKGRVDVGFGQRGQTGGSSCFGGDCSWTESKKSFNIGAFAEHDTDQGTSFGITGRYSMLSGEVKKNINSGRVSGNVSLNIPLSWNR